jgi:hypothetical protein
MSISVVILVCLFLSTVAFVLVLMAWRRSGRAPEARIVSLLALCAAVYCFGYSREAVQTSLAGAIFWLHVEYLGIPWIPALWVLLARRHNHLQSQFWLLLAIPLLTFAAEWSNSFHGLFDRSMVLLFRPPFWVVSV